MDKTQPIRLKHFHENDGGRAKNGTQCKQCGEECIYWKKTEALFSKYYREIDFKTFEKSSENSIISYEKL